MRHFIVSFITVLFALTISAQEQTLRVDYVFSGTDKATEISLAGLYSFDGWAGRCVNLDKVPVKGNGQISMTDLASGKVIYMQSFSTLFQEWKTTEEATRLRKAFENTFLLPMPSAKAVVKVELYDFFGEVSASLSHQVNPKDILIRHLDPQPAQHKYLLKSGAPEEKIDVAIVAEGYTAEEMSQFYRDAQIAMDAILAHKPFDQYKDCFNFVAIALESEDSGVSVPREGLWKDTAVGSNYDTFYSDRYLTTSCVWKMHDALCGIPYEHLVILANTDTYGGGGIYNSYTLTTALHKDFKPVVVHEFGHSFAGLADEYYYDDQFVEYYYPDSEPWEQNITTLYDFKSKWDDMLPMVIGIPTEPVEGNIWEKFAAGEDMNKMIGVYEGAGYQSKGVYRPFPDCRMKTNAAESFCPVCQRAIARLIEFYTEEK
ncbi:MAG: peptidase M64 [Bacteroidales bacterium]|nr:peptidase M64 [Bacteroidales bacterium]